MRTITTVATALIFSLNLPVFAEGTQGAAQPSSSAEATLVAPVATGRARPAIIYPNAASCRPAYPPAALRAHAQGDTRVRFSIDANGQVLAAKTVQSSGQTPEHQLLDQAAVEALSRCPFVAGVGASGKPVASQIEVTYRWIAQ